MNYKFFYENFKMSPVKIYSVQYSEVDSFFGRQCTSIRYVNYFKNRFPTSDGMFNLIYSYKDSVQKFTDPFKKLQKVHHIGT